MTETIVIKVGGVASTSLTQEFFTTLSHWQEAGKNIVIVHGGGFLINELAEKLAVPTVKKNGLRVTTQEMLEITRMVLIGQVQPTFIQCLSEAGFTTLGLNAADNQLLVGEQTAHADLGFVGELTAVNQDFLADILTQQIIPVIAPLAISPEGQWLNVNGDHAAAKLATLIQADALYLLTDVPGIADETGVKESVTVTEAHDLIAQEVIHGGMIPKVTSALSAAQNGVKSVFITDTIAQPGTKILAKELVQL